MGSAVVVREVSYQSLRQVYPDWHFGTFASRNDWICPALMVALLKKTASLMMFPAWNCERSAAWTGPIGAARAGDAPNPETISITVTAHDPNRAIADGRWLPVRPAVMCSVWRMLLLSTTV